MTISSLPGPSNRSTIEILGTAASVTGTIANLGLSVARGTTLGGLGAGAGVGVAGGGGGVGGLSTSSGTGGSSPDFQQLINEQVRAQTVMLQVNLQSNTLRSDHDARMAAVRNIKP